MMMPSYYSIAIFSQGHTEIAQLDHGSPVSTLGVQECVLQLDVAVGDVHLVTVVQSQYELLKEPAGLVLIQPSTAQPPQSTVRTHLLIETTLK
jgi:hypothetical protein